MKDDANNDGRSALWDTFAADTAARPREIASIRRALSVRTVDERVATALLRHVPPVSAAEVASLRERMATPPRQVLSWWWALSAVGGGGALGMGMALAAAMLLVVVWWGAGRATVEDAPLSVAIAPSTGRVSHSPAPGVRLVAEGDGTVGGTTLSPVVRWTAGTLAAEVAPGQGINFTVETREATVRVIGTLFDVTRDALGTKVGVTRGTVEVACAATADATPHRLTAGQRVICLPTTGPGLLGRANALKTGGQSPELILATAQTGLVVATGPFHAELRALEAEALLALGRDGEARASADRYLAERGPRRAEMLQIAGQAALSTGGCKAALPYLLALEELGAGDPEFLLECEGEE